MRAAVLIGAMALMVAAPSIASETMSAGEFLARAEPLLKRNKATLIFSGEARKLMRVVGESAHRNRERYDADRAAGRRPTACLPAKGKAGIGLDELMNNMRAIPPAQRGQSFDHAFTAIMARKYPCRG